MTNLSKMADQLLSYLQVYTPDFAKDFNPGISRLKIEEVLSPLQYTLPDDFYELYQWRNGHPEYFKQPLASAYICQFSSIEQVSGNKQWDCYGKTQTIYKGHITLPFIENGPQFFAIALERSYQTEAHIVDVDAFADHPILRYDSITSMLTSTVECFEARAFYLNNEGQLQEEFQLSAEILRNNNPRTIAEAMSDVMTSLDIYGLNDEVSQESYSALIDSCLSGLETLRPMRPPEAISIVQSSLTRLQGKSSDRAWSARYGLSNWLRDVGVLEP
jgi:hypothetical protein